MLSPKVDFRILNITINNKKLIVFEIHPAIEQPIRFQNISYIRIGSTTQKLSNHPQKERKIWRNIDKKSFGDGVSMENLTASEILDFLDYSKFFSLTKKELPTETAKFVEKMAEYNLVNKF